MIFIGPKLSEENAHFVSNIIDSVGTGDDLLIDLKKIKSTQEVLCLIDEHMSRKKEDVIVYNAYEDENFFIELKKSFPELNLFMFFSDDEWRHYNYDRYLALYADIFSIACEKHIKNYHDYGFENIILCRWACNPGRFYPFNEEMKKFDVTFVGAAYGKRIEYIRYLLKHGVDVKVFGKDWDKYRDIRSSWGGFLSHEELLRVFSQSRINLNFLWTSYAPDKSAVKGRTLELASCKAFQLSNYIPELQEYEFEDGTNIAFFKNKEELREKILYYLDHEREREVIAASAYRLVIEKHTWKNRFENIFKASRKSGGDRSQRYKLLVVLSSDVSHKINPKDKRLQIDLVPKADLEPCNFQKYDGILFLERDSTINNETLRMMAFALVGDSSDMVLSNFYIGKGEARYWIRFKDRYVEKNREVVAGLPVEAKMFSPLGANNFINNRFDYMASSLSFIEYPTYSIEGMGFIKKILLRTQFASYAKKEEFRKSLRSLNLLRTLHIMTDYYVQKKINN